LDGTVTVGRSSTKFQEHRIRVESLSSLLLSLLYIEDLDIAHVWFPSFENYEAPSAQRLLPSEVADIVISLAAREKWEPGPLVNRTSTDMSRESDLGRDEDQIGGTDGGISLSLQEVAAVAIVRRQITRYSSLLMDALANEGSSGETEAAMLSVEDVELTRVLREVASAGRLLLKLLEQQGGLEYLRALFTQPRRLTSWLPFEPEVGEELKNDETTKGVLGVTDPFAAILPVQTYNEAVAGVMYFLAKGSVTRLENYIHTAYSGGVTRKNPDHVCCLLAALFSQMVVERKCTGLADCKEALALWLREKHHEGILDSLEIEALLWVVVREAQVVGAEGPKPTTRELLLRQVAVHAVVREYTGQST
jgi:hypothetical protein